MGPDPGVGVGRSEVSESQLGLEVAGEPGQSRQGKAGGGGGGRGGAPGPMPLACPRARRPRAPAGLGSPRGGCAEPSAAGATLLQTPETQCPGSYGCRRNHGGCLSSPPLLYLSVYNMATCL